MGQTGIPTQSVATAKTIFSPKGVLWRRKSIISENDDFIFLQDVYNSMTCHCLEENPLEACGLLSGKNRMAYTWWPMVNVLKSRNEFAMDTRQIEDTFRKMEDKGEQLVGIYHSHPNSPPFPSPDDIAYAHYPEAVYIIVSLYRTHPEVHCFRICNRQSFPVHHGIQPNRS